MICDGLLAHRVKAKSGIRIFESGLTDNPDRNDDVNGLFETDARQQGYLARTDRFVSQAAYGPPGWTIELTSLCKSQCRRQSEMVGGIQGWVMR